MSIDSPRYKDNVGIKITDEELEKIIGDRLHKNPLFYLNFLKKLIDEIDEVIPDDVLFDLLQPSFSIHDDVHNTSERPAYEGSALSVSTESVDMLFRPGVRKKLYEWQCVIFGESSSDSQRKEAMDKMKKVFQALMAEEKGGQDVVSKQDAEYNKLYKVCQEIFKRQDKNQQIKENFPDIGQEIVREINNGSHFLYHNAGEIKECAVSEKV
jgi:hypothetical protein